MHLFSLLFLAVTAAPAGLLGKFFSHGSFSRELLTFALIVVITSGLAVAPETVSVLSHWVKSPNNLSALVELSIHQIRSFVAASLFAGFGWIVAVWIERIFED